MVILEARGALEGEVDGRIKDLISLVFYVIIVAKQVILRSNVMLREMIFAVVNYSKEIMHRLHDRMKTEKTFVCFIAYDECCYRKGDTR